MFVHHNNTFVTGLSRIIQIALPLLVIAIGLGSGYLAMSYILHSAQAAAATTANETTTKRPATLGAQTMTASPQTSTAPASTPTASSTTAKTPASRPALCTTSSYNRPSQPSMPTAGLHIAIDNPTYYTVGTDLPSELYSLVHNCGQQQPNTSGYDASTSYNLAWSYSVVQSGNACKLDDVRVGIRINQLLPVLEPGRPVAVQTLWNNASSTLYAHEQQHVAIDSNGARSLYDTLSTMSGSCSTLDAEARNAANSRAALLHNENDSLDNATNHGQL